MKFFWSTGPALVALVILLGIAPAFASEAPDPADAYAPETGEVLTDESVYDPDGSDTSVDDFDNDKGDVFPPVLTEPVSVTCSGSEVTVYLDDRSYTSVVDVGDGEGSAVIGVFGNDTFGEDSSGYTPVPLSGFLRAMFGEYTPKTQTVFTYFDGQLLEVSTEYVPGVAGMDMEWIASVILFGLVIYCLFRMLGGMVR